MCADDSEIALDRLAVVVVALLVASEIQFLFIVK